MHSQALGAYKGIGYGDIKNVAINFSCITQSHHASKIDNNRFGIIITPNKAFCLSQHQRGNNSHTIETGTTNDKTGIDNHFQSEDHITGAAIKGAIATQLRKQGGNTNLNELINNPDYPVLSKHLNQLHISHAQAQKNDNTQRPWTQPHSLVIANSNEKDGKQIVCDVILKDTAGLINNTAPRFSTDWKNKDWQIAIDNTNNPAQPERTLSLHTAIENNAAKEGQLYSIESVAPDKHHWLANIS